MENNNLISAINLNLEKGINLLNIISDNDYSNCSIAPYNSSIGSHIRHVLDIFDCIFEGLQSLNINLIKRKRNVQPEKFTEHGIDYFNEMIEKLNSLESNDLNRIVNLTDDLGLGEVTVKFTVVASLVQAHSHAIHHFAIVGYIISQLGIQLPDKDFGFNPTTPRVQVKK